MKKITFLLVFLSTLTYGQKAGHKHYSWVKNVYFNADFTQFMSNNLNEIAYWDVATMKPFWVFEAKQFGCEIPDFWYFNPTTNLEYFKIFNSRECVKLVETKKLLYSTFTSANNRLFEKIEGDYIVRKEINGKNEIIYLTNVKTNQEKQAYKGKHLSFNYNLIDNQLYINTGEEVKRLDIASGKWEEFPFVTKYPHLLVKVENTLFSNNKMFDLNTKITKPFLYYNPESFPLIKDKLLMFDIPNNKFGLFDMFAQNCTYYPFKHVNSQKDVVKFVGYNQQKNMIYFLENEKMEGKDFYYEKSFLSSYDSVTGNYIQSISLNDLSTESILAERKKSDELRAEREKIEEEERKRDTPENRLRIRLSKLYNQVVMNTTNKRMYQIVPDKPIYEGNLVRMNALHHNKTKIEEVYDRIENIEDQSKYVPVQQFGKCYVCSGEGVTHQGVTSTVADYEYTLGVKVVKTTTSTSGCQHCGGGGLLPL